MPETTNQQAVKKRSLSNYLSNVNSRKEELERIAQQEKIAKDAINEEEETEEKGEEKIIPSHESNNDNGTSQKNDTIEPIHQLQEKIIKPKQDTEKEKDSIINQSNEELIPKDMGHKALPIQDTLNDASNANEDIEIPLNQRESSRTDINEHESFSRENLQAILKEPKISQEILEPLKEESILDKNEEATDDELMDEAPTAENSPLKPKRGRLVRGDRRTPDYKNDIFANGNDSDSALSDIEESGSFNITSSVLHSEGSPIKTNGKPREKYNKIASSPPKRTKPSHIAVPKISKQKKNVYRDSGGRNRLQIACDKGKYE